MKGDDVSGVEPGAAAGGSLTAQRRGELQEPALSASMTFDLSAEATQGTAPVSAVVLLSYKLVPDVELVQCTL